MKRLTLFATGLFASLTTFAQADFTLEYTTEMQTEFRHANWLNQLHFACDVPIGRHFAFEAGTYSFAKTRGGSLIDDLQGFSNIDADNFPLALAVLSLDWKTEHTTLALGIRNINENYFVTDVSSFFTQSSHGIFPTIAANFPIANYPFSSIGTDFQWRNKGWGIDASLYNGIGYLDIFGEETVFRFNPKRDGIFGALSISNEGEYGNAQIGGAFRGHQGEGLGAAWTYAEIGLGNSLNLLAQYSVSPSKNAECNHYAGLGLYAKINNKLELGAAESFAKFTEDKEWATEVSAKISFTENLALQPTAHICSSGGEANCVALVRLYCNLLK